MFLRGFDLCVLLYSTPTAWHNGASVFKCSFSLHILTPQVLSIAAIQTHMEIAATQAEEESDVSKQLEKDFQSKLVKWKADERNVQAQSPPPPPSSSFGSSRSCDPPPPPPPTPHSYVRCRSSFRFSLGSEDHITLQGGSAVVP